MPHPPAEQKREIHLSKRHHVAARLLLAPLPRVPLHFLRHRPPDVHAHVDEPDLLHQFRNRFPRDPVPLDAGHLGFRVELARLRPGVFKVRQCDRAARLEAAEHCAEQRGEVRDVVEAQVAYDEVELLPRRFARTAVRGVVGRRRQCGILGVLEHHAQRTNVLGGCRSLELGSQGVDHARGGVDGEDGARVGRDAEGEEAGAAADFQDVGTWRRFASVLWELGVLADIPVLGTKLHSSEDVIPCAATVPWCFCCFRWG